MVLITATMATQDSWPTTILFPYRLFRYSKSFHSIGMWLIDLRPVKKPNSPSCTSPEIADIVDEDHLPSGFETYQRCPLTGVLAGSFF